ncbi:hypothetical protein L218DRAFT_955328 [Marasmius fiardii PR-910]|nr:hypothetical protein L218DRAFT_955328 [Marasmius fiardii PR-910]
MEGTPSANFWSCAIIICGCCAVEFDIIPDYSIHTCELRRALTLVMNGSSIIRTHQRWKDSGTTCFFASTNWTGSSPFNPNPQQAQASIH